VAREEEKTLFEIGKKWWGEWGEKEKIDNRPPELKVFNPLQARCRDVLLVMTPELAGKQLMVMEMYASEIRVGKEVFPFMDYDVHDEATDTRVVVRIQKKDGTTPDVVDFDIIVLSKDYEMGYDEELHKRILPGGILEENEDGKIVATYTRLNGAKQSYAVQTTVFAFDGSTKQESVETWDFGRDTEDGVEFYFVEMNDETKMFQMFRGRALSSMDDVMPLRNKVTA